jgi:hypothetical protein
VLDAFAADRDFADIEWGSCSLFVRTATSGEADALRTEECSSADLLAKVLLDADGRHILKDKDAAKLQSCSSAVVSRLLDVALKGNGLPGTGWNQPNRQFSVDSGHIVELR